MSCRLSTFPSLGIRKESKSFPASTKGRCGRCGCFSVSENHVPPTSTSLVEHSLALSLIIHLIDHHQSDRHIPSWHRFQVTLFKPTSDPSRLASAVTRPCQLMSPHLLLYHLVTRLGCLAQLSRSCRSVRWPVVSNTLQSLAEFWHYANKRSTD